MKKENVIEEEKKVKKGRKTTKKEEKVVETSFEVVKEEPKEKVEKDDALVTCRVLFVSVLDKIYLAILGLILILSTYSNFKGDISSLQYGFWGRVGSEILTLVGIAIAYLFFNWLYRCVVKTILCVTEKEIYRENYLPFVRTETTIPLNKVTGIASYNFLWIFRAVMIFQYGRFPMVFWTWNNQEFKDKVEELMTVKKAKVKNKYEEKNLLSNYGFLKYLGIGLAAIVALVGVVRFFNYVFSAEKQVAGTYTYSTYKVQLDNDGTCELDGFRDNINSCSWNYNKDSNTVYVEYAYRSSYYFSSTARYSMTFKYDSKQKTLDYNGQVFKK